MFWQIEDGFEAVNWRLSVEAAGGRYFKKRPQGCELYEEARLIGSHFREMGNWFRQELDSSYVELIPSQESLRIVSEDSLFDGRFRDNLRFFEFVRFEFLSTSRLRQFLEIIDDFNICGSSTILKSLLARLVLPVDRSSLGTSKYGMSHFPPSDSDPLDGIIARLTRECGGNVHDHEVVEVTSSGQQNARSACQAKNAADLKANSYFWSVGQYGTKKSGKVIAHTRNNWLCYNFKNRRVVLTHYAIRSYDAGGVNSYHPKLWFV
jgi:hypothetical protein